MTKIKRIAKIGFMHIENLILLGLTGIYFIVSTTFHLMFLFKSFQIINENTLGLIISSYLVLFAYYILNMILLSFIEDLYSKSLDVNSDYLSKNIGKTYYTNKNLSTKLMYMFDAIKYIVKTIKDSELKDILK